MPTGYTHKVQTGEVTSLADYAKLCARGMMALASMRDDPMDAPIPERFDPQNTFADARLAEAQAFLANAKTLSAADAESLANADHARELADWTERRAERALERQRYETMLEKVRAWNGAPDGLKGLMVEQLVRSIDFDCREYPEDDRLMGKPQALSGAEWLEDRVAKAERDVAYWTKQREEEIARTEGRNAWLAQLRDGLRGTD